MTSPDPCVFPDDGFTIGARWGSDPGRDLLDAHAEAIRAMWADGR
jgi:hypothetical protein